MKGSCLAALYLTYASCGAYASGEGGAEAAAVYSVGAGTNSIVAVPSEDFSETVAFMLVPTASADEEGLEAAEEAIEDREFKKNVDTCHANPNNFVAAATACARA